MTESERAYAVSDLAEKWGCSTDAIYDMIDAGVLRAFLIGKPDKKRRKGIRISAKEVTRWEDAQENESPLTPLAPGNSDGTAKRLLRNAAKAATASG